ncbi:MAG: ribbon-helix-helix protein, CopG family [bacterium]|nr:ribbon-helix-helix protein, CopG family [bacterium]
MKAISVHVAEEHYQQFKFLAARRGRPVAELVREAMATYLSLEQQAGRSILDIAAHPSGRLLAGWSRSELYDEMIED